MERRSILEKLGLVEKVEETNQNDENVPTVEIAEQKPVEKEKPQFAEYVKKYDAEKEKENVVKETKQADGYEDPIAAVRKKKLLKIEEIYKNYDISTEGINSLSIVESFQKALPDYLPTDVKRQSILNIIASSNVKVGNLVNDGNDKLRCLNDFSRLFSDESREVISGFEDEISKLNEKIKNYKTAIDNMKNLQTEQEFTLKYEIEKISNILQFIDPQN